MALVTLIGEKLAINDSEFTYIGSQSECRNCKLKTVCFNLKPGRQYKITNVRDKRHNCSVHEGNVVVVEVSELPLITSIDKKLAEGTKTEIKKIDCIHIGCEQYELCINNALQNGKQYTIKKIHEKIKCPAGYERYKAELTD